MVDGINGANKQVPLNQDSTNVKKDVIIKKSIKTPIDFKYSAGNANNTAGKTTGYNDLWTGKDTVGYRADVWTDEDTARYRATLSPDELRRFDDMMAKLHPNRSNGDGQVVGPISTSDIDSNLKKIADELGYKLDKPIDIDPDALKKIADKLLAARNKPKEPGDDFKPVKDPGDPTFKPVKEPLPGGIRAKLHPNTPKLTGANKPKEPEGPLTAGEIDYARKIGADVADFLVGYTNDFEQNQTVARLRDSVTNRNVMEFLSGYEANKGRGDHFFTQLATEYGFEDKQKYMQNVAGKLSAYLKANGQPDLAKEIEVALVDGSISKSEAAKLDEIVQAMLPSMRDLKR